MNQESTTSPDTESKDSKVSKSYKTLTGIVYILQILALATAGITLIIAAAINYLKRSAVKGTWLDSHFDWQLKTSLFALILAIVGGLSLQFGIGYFVLIGGALWLVYRVVRGWLRLQLDRPINEDEF